MDKDSQHLGPSIAARIDLTGGCKISHPCSCRCTCASAEAERTAVTELLGATGAVTTSVAFSLHCQPTSCVSDLADILLVSHFDLLISAICRFASSQVHHVLDVAWPSHRSHSGELSIVFFGHIADNSGHSLGIPTIAIARSVGLLTSSGPLRIVP